jgi:hypothetical protein
LVSWIDAQPHALLRRFAPDGKPVGAAFDAGKQALPLAVVSAEASVFALDSAASGSSLVEIPIGCGK